MLVSALFHKALRRKMKFMVPFKVKKNLLFLRLRENTKMKSRKLSIRSFTVNILRGAEEFKRDVQDGGEVT